MKKINICLIFIILCVLGGMAAFVFPFYRAVMNDVSYGGYNVAGTISISGISLLFGLGTVGTGYYENKNFVVAQNFGPLPLASVLVLGLIIALVLILIRRKANYIYFGFTCLFIAIGLAVAVLAFYNRELCQITLNNPTLYPEFKSEGRGIGILVAMAAGAGIVVFGILDLICIYAAIRHAAPEVLDGYYEYDQNNIPRIGQQQAPLALMNYGEDMQENFDACEKELNILKDLFENGMISQKEYDTKREDILSRYFKEEM